MVHGRGKPPCSPGFLPVRGDSLTSTGKLSTGNFPYAQFQVYVVAAIAASLSRAKKQ
jgi:hypothetical protein